MGQIHSDLTPALDLGASSSKAARRTQKRAHRRASAPPTTQWELDDAITVVLYAGLGGACQGLEEAGCPVHVAVNHDPVALAAHAAIHPHTRHIRGDIFDVDPVEATSGRRVRILWASPDCKDHSVAKGGAPRSPRVRSLAWQVCRWAGKTRPSLIMMENVREIRGWGPLIAKRDKQTGRVVKLDGSIAAPGERVPVQLQQLVRDPARLGRSFRRFVAHLQHLGYDYQDRDLCCADYGVPTSRRRWFAVARRQGGAIGWPERTHAPAKTHQALGLQRWVGAHTIIDWSIPMPSIFDRQRPLAEATNRRIAVGMRRYVLENPQPFIVPITHSRGGNQAVSTNDPLLTQTCSKGGEFAVVAPALGYLVQAGHGERPGQQPRALDAQAPIGTLTTSGGHHAAVATWLVQHNLGVVGHAADEPLSTLTTSGTQQQAAAAYLTHHRGTSTAQDAQQPVPALTTSGRHVAATAAFLTKYYSSGSTAQAADDATHALTSRMRLGVVTVHLQGQPYAVVDIGMRMLEPHEAAAAHELLLPRTITLDGVTRRLTKTEAMRLVGNSVPKRMARLLAQANRASALYTDGRLAAD